MAKFGDFLARLRGGGGNGDVDRGRLGAILGLNRELASARDRRQLLLRLVDESVRLFGDERAFLLVPRSDGSVHVEAARNFDGETVQNAERKLSMTVVRRALAGEGVFTPDAQEGEFAASASIADMKLRSVLAMPLRVGELVLGCIYLDHRFHKEAFQEEDLPWLQAFADQGAIVLHLHELLSTVASQKEQLALHNRELAATVQAQQEELSELRPTVGRDELRHRFAEIKGSAPALMRSLVVLDRVVDSHVSVVLVGESGTGKELAARALHEEGARAAGPFVAVNTASIAPAVLESELFGHVRGAFTGADRDRLGLLRLADGGTLFLDEITEMDLELQARLLRVLEERRVRPVGGDDSHAVDLRVVAATNRDPQRAIADGLLREDLWFRLAVVTVRLPPLRERLEDLPLLVEGMLAEAAAARGGTSRQPSKALLASLLARPWPGNLRELRNVMQELDTLAGEGPLPTEAPPPLLGRTGRDGAEAAPAAMDLAAVERWAILRALRVAAGNKTEAARLLGIARRTLYSKLPDGDSDPRE